MAMNFFEAQRQAKKRTLWIVIAFLAMTILVAALIEFGLRYYAYEEKQPPTPYVGVIFLVVTFVVAGFYLLRFSTQGGDAVAESVGALRIEPEYNDPLVQRFRNVVHEMSIAAGLPIPSMYIIDADEINAFAAGMKPEKSAIAVTRGALEKLNRDELQGVIAHEFGHVASGDSKLNLRLAAMIMGFFILFYLGLRLLQIAALSRGDRRGAPVMMLVALSFFIAGAVTWFFGSILRSMVSRQREYLADACSVQFTRNPSGIANALRKIGQEQIRDMPKTGIGFSHMYFSHQSLWGRLFATHPPLEKRIAAIEGRTYLTDDFEVKQ